MKTILRIFVILTAAVVVASVLYLTVEHTTLFAGDTRGPDLSQPAAMAAADTGQLPVPSEGGRDGGSASFGRGLTEVFGSLAKLSVITGMVLLIQVGLLRLQRWRSRWLWKPRP